MKYPNDDIRSAEEVGRQLVVCVYAQKNCNLGLLLVERPQSKRCKQKVGQSSSRAQQVRIMHGEREMKKR